MTELSVLDHPAPELRTTTPQVEIDWEENWPHRQFQRAARNGLLLMLMAGLLSLSALLEPIFLIFTLTFGLYGMAYGLAMLGNADRCARRVKVDRDGIGLQFGGQKHFVYWSDIRAVRINHLTHDRWNGVDDLPKDKGYFELLLKNSGSIYCPSIAWLFYEPIYEGIVREGIPSMVTWVGKFTRTTSWALRKLETSD